MATLASEAALLGTTLREWLRALCGYAGDLVTLPDLTCDIALRTAMQRINTRDPILGIGSFSTVAHQQKYSPLPAGAYFLRQAWWCNLAILLPYESPGGVNAWTMQISAAFGQPIDDLGTYTSPDPATVAIVLRKAEQVQRWIGTNFAAVNNGTDVYLSPVPGDVRSVYFSYTGQRFATPGDVTAPYFDAFWWAAQAAILAGIATGAGAVTQVVDSQEGTSITLSSGKSASDRTAACELAFLRCISVPPVEGWLFE